VNVELLELAASRLDDLLPEVVFVGGAVVGLWITDPGAPPARPTKDVDVVVEVTTRGAYYDFEARLRERGLVPDRESEILCRYRDRESELILDAMPPDADILGFASRWQKESLPHSIDRLLPSGASIRVVSPPCLLATKLEAFAGRGGGDLLGSRDFADIISLVDGRAELVDEVAGSHDGFRAFVAEEIGVLLNMPRIQDGLHGAVPSDASARVDLVVLPALLRLAGRSESP